MKIKLVTKIKWLLLTVVCGVLFSCDKESEPYINLPAYGPEQVFLALSSNNVLTLYNAADVRNVGTNITVTGLAANERLVDVDFRPATGELYGVSSLSYLYIINLTTGTTKAVSTTALNPALNGTVTSIDFNPTADLLRIVTNRGQNLRVNPETGAVVGTDTNVPNTNISGIAYSNSYAGATTTVLYDIDPAGGKLFQQIPPNAGTLVAVGDLGAVLGNTVSFDISPDSKNALATGKVGDSTKLYTINLATGKATLSGKFKLGTDIQSIAIPTSPVAYAVDQSGNLLTFDPTLLSPTVYTKALSGLQTGETILGMDIRPLNGQLYALGSTNRLYTINAATGVVSQVGAGVLGTPLNGSSFGFDFNPQTGMIKVISNTRQILDIDPINATVTAGNAISPNTVMLSAAAFDNNFRTTTATALYVIDHESDKLNRLVPTTGAVTEIGELKVNVTGTNGFDISSTNEGFAVFTVGSKTSLYTVNINTGLATARFDFTNGITAFTLGLY